MFSQPPNALARNASVTFENSARQFAPGTLFNIHPTAICDRFYRRAFIGAAVERRPRRTRRGCTV